VSNSTRADSVGASPNQVLTRARFNAGLSVRDLAKRAGCTHQTLYDLEADSGRRVRPATAKRIADVLGLKPTDLFVVDDLERS